MSTYMGRELELLVQSMICGALLVLVYDGIRIFRIIGKRVKRAVLSALRNFAGSRCLVLGNRAFL